MRSVFILLCSNYVIWNTSWLISLYNTLTVISEANLWCCVYQENGWLTDWLIDLTWTAVKIITLWFVTQLNWCWVNHDFGSHLNQKVLSIWFITLPQNWSQQYTETKQHLTIPCFFTIFSVLTVLHRKILKTCYHIYFDDKYNRWLSTATCHST